MTQVGLPDYPDGYAFAPEGAFVRVAGTSMIIRWTDSTQTSYRIVGQTPDDLLGPVNTTGSQEQSNNIICDRTGFRVSVKEGLKEEWNGAMVRAESWEPRQPLDYARPQAAERRKGSPRPEHPDNFRTTPVTLSDLDP